MEFIFKKSASALYRIKTVPLPFPVYTVPDPFDFLLKARAQQVSLHAGKEVRSEKPPKHF